MGDSSSSSKDVTQEIPTTSPAVYYPRSLFESLRDTILKCLGFEIESKNCSSPKQNGGASSQEQAASSSTADKNVDPPSTATTTVLDPQADPPTGENPTVVVLAAPRRPGAETGSGPQTN